MCNLPVYDITKEFVNDMTVILHGFVINHIDDGWFGDDEFVTTGYYDTYEELSNAIVAYHTRMKQT